MKSRGDGVLWVLLSFLFIGIVFLGCLIYVNLPGTPVSLKGNFQNYIAPIVESGNLTKSMQFYPQMRFKDRTITYYLDPACSPEKTSQINNAFSIIEKDTSLRFVLDSNSPEIDVSCSEVAPPPKDAGHFVAGEGGPYEILNSSYYAIILSSKISLYRDETCPTTHIALHELLHALGFDHNSNPSSILYPTLDCKQTLDQYFIDDLNDLYKEDSLPDLAIVSLNGTKSGRYVSFEISVSNRGLQDSGYSNLSLVAEDGSLIKEFDLGNIELGSTKTLTVSNLATPRSSKSYKFIVDRENLIKELDKTNNEAQLILEY